MVFGFSLTEMTILSTAFLVVICFCCVVLKGVETPSWPQSMIDLPSATQPQIPRAERKKKPKVVIPRVVVPPRVWNGRTYGESYVIGNTKKPDGLVTFAHGLGTSGSLWEPLARRLAKEFPNLLFVLPSSRIFPLSFGLDTNAWFDIYLLGGNDVAGVKESASYLHEYAAMICRRYRVDLSNVVYGGFSQGAVVALWAGVTAPVRPFGIFSFSGHLINAKELRTAAKNFDVPLFAAYGDEDNMQPLTLSRRSIEKLVNVVGYSRGAITEKMYPAADHEITFEMESDFKHWLHNLNFGLYRRVRSSIVPNS